jgi:hypothetical protein
MATTPATPRIPRDIEPDTEVIASEDAFADDTTRRAADEGETSPDASSDDQATLEDAAGTDDEDVKAEAPGRGPRRRR